MSQPPPVAPAPVEPARPSARSGRPEPVEGRRLLLLEHPLLYVILLGLYAALELSGCLALPGGPSQAAAPRRSIEDLLRQPGDIPFAPAVAVVVPLLVGTGLLVGYVTLRAHNVRVFPRCEFPVVPWTWRHLVRVGVVLFVLARLVPVGVAWLTRAASASVTKAVLSVGTANATMLLACLFVVALVGRRGHPLRLLGLWEPRPFRRAALGLVGYLMCTPATFLAALVSLLLWQRMGLPAAQQEVLVEAVGMSRGAFALVLVGAVVVAPLTEEVLFRGLLYATLRRTMGPLGALVWSAAAFAFLHGHAVGFASLFVIGFLLGYLYERTGSLAASIAAHGANNLYSLLVAYLSFHQAPL